MSRFNQAIIFSPQCGSALIGVISPPFSATLAKITLFGVIWFIYLMLTTLLALAATRIYLILKVS